jgi:hypothetical protein
MGTRNERSSIMNLSQLLASRPALLRQAALANAAFAYAVLRGLGRRIENARLQGPVRLLAVDPAAERFAPQLIALAGSQSVLEEHFDESDLVRLADALAFTAPGPATEFEFQLEDMFAHHSPALRTALLAAGVEICDELGAPDRRV